jgi:uncharacterized protein YqjF (DUF2071 family)
MRWEELLFAHWPVPAGPLASLLHPDLELDTYDGQAWLGIVPFRMAGTAPRLCPALPGLSGFLELNVRTYVRYRGTPGVWFFSLDATSWLGVRAARLTYYLPYFDAAISVQRQGTRLRYHSRRTDWRTGPASLDIEYEPTGPQRPSRPGTLDHWLTERYRLYSQTPGGRLVYGEVRHEPWPLQPAVAAIHELNMTDWMGLALPPAPPLLHYAKGIAVRAGRPRFAG